MFRPPVKAPTPIRSTPSSAPLEAMVEKQQAHIEELVMKNRTSEQQIQKMKGELSTERQRHDGLIQQLKQQQHEQIKQWKDGYESLQRLWRIACLRQDLEVNKERTNVLKMKKELREERLAKVQRDFRISTFQTKEMELEDRIYALQDEVEEFKWLAEQEAQKRATLKAQYQQSLDDLQEAADERKALEVRPRPWRCAKLK